MSKALLTGTPWKVIIFFTIPLLIGNVVQQMYQVIDAAIVGQHLGVNPLAAVGSTGALGFLLIGFSWGLTTGFAIPTAQAFGAGDLKAVRLSIAAGVILTAIGAAIVTVIGVTMARTLLTLMQTPAVLLDDATTFASITFAGTTATMYFNYLSAIIRAKGDSRTPLIFLMIASIVNIGLVILLVQYVGMGVGGAALATVIAQVCSALLCVEYVRRYVPEFHVKRGEWAESVTVMRRHLRIGLPTGFQASIIAIGTLTVQVQLNLLGPDAVAAFTTATRVENIAVGFMSSLGLGVSTFAAQNFGAKQFTRIITGVRQGQWISLGVAATWAIVLIAFGETVIRWFVGSGHNSVVSMAHEYFIVNGIAYVALGILFVTRGALQGLGKVMIPTISGVVELAMRMITAIVLGGLLGFAGIIWAGPSAWIAAVILLVPAWVVAKKELLASQATEESLVQEALDRQIERERAVCAC